MKLIKHVLFIVSISFCFMNMKCESNDEVIIDTDNLLLGSWEATAFNENKITFNRTSELPENNFGIQFKEKGQLVDRSPGWGKTPPLIFQAFKGKWEMIDNTIAITQEHFPNNYQWKIEALSNTELIVTRDISPQELDYLDLLFKFDAIAKDVTGITCSDASAFCAVPYGAKACGGPQGFAFYPKTIDTLAFLEKVDKYTQAEISYNEKWGVFSTCDVPHKPETVICENGVPTLLY